MTSPKTPTGSQSDRAGQVEQLLVQADGLIESGSYDVALDVIRRAQGLDPENHYALAFVGRIQRLMSARKARGGSGTPKPGSQYAPASFLKNGAETPATPPPVPVQPPAEARKAALQSAIAHILSRAHEYCSARNFDRALAELERARLLDSGNADIARLEGEIKKEIEEDRARMTVEQRQRQEEEESRKREAVENEITRIRQEKEEKRHREEEARKKAQEDRIQQYLASAATFIASGKLDEAANQLAFVVAIDPLNAAAAELQRKVREIQERKRHEEAEQKRKKQEEDVQRQTALRTAIQKNCETANTLAAAKKFNDALRAITRAYMLDPVNEEVRACEQRILEMQEEAYRAAEEEKRAAEEALRQAQEEELRRLTEAERERLLREQEEVLEQEKRANKEEIVRHLAKAREHLKGGGYQDALGEVAQAFAIDPFDEDVRLVEQEIMAAQSQSANVEPETPVAGPTAEPPVDTERIDEHLVHAKRHRAAGELTRALDELTKAFVIDPLNSEVQSLQEEIEAEMKGEAKPVVIPPTTSASPATTAAAPVAAPAPASTPAPKPVNMQKVLFHVVRARKMMESGAFEDAMAEVALGLMLDKENSDLLQMEATLWELQSSAPAELPQVNREENERLIRIHLAAADQFRSKGEFARALDEIAKAYQVDPLHAEAKQKENEIRQEEMRRNHPGETNLKLVYPKKGAAGA